MQADSRSNLIRGLKNVTTAQRRIAVVWLVCTVLTEALLFDIVSQFVQHGAFGQVSHGLFLPASWLGLDQAGVFAGPQWFRLALFVVVLLGVRTVCVSMRDQAADSLASVIVREIRERLFRETHRTSGTLIAPELAEETIRLVEVDARNYGDSVAETICVRDSRIARMVAGFVIAAAIRIDFAVILACAAVLFGLLDRAVRRARDGERLAQRREYDALRLELREELREAYQGRAIGSEMGQDRPSDECLDHWTLRDDQFAGNARAIVVARRWGQVAIIALTLLCLATRSASDNPAPGQWIALLTLGTFVAAYFLLEPKGPSRLMDDRPESEHSPIEPLYHALTRSARIWDKSNPRILQPCRNQLTIESIPLTQRSQDPESVRTLDVVLPARRITAIVCPDAADRSKLMRLLARWEDPDSGRILVDGVDLREFSIASTRLQIGTIRPEAYVNDGSVTENIVLNDPRANLANVIDAAKAVHAHRMIQRLPRGYDTFIDSGKPAGEQAYLHYLIALARGKWHDPSILIVEEPAVPMTRGTKELLRDAYRRLRQDRTVILFSRHAASVLAADQVVVIGNSRVIVGTPKELMASHRGFRRAMMEMGLGLKARQRSKAKSRSRGKRIVDQRSASEPGQQESRPA